MVAPIATARMTKTDNDKPQVAESNNHMSRLHPLQPLGRRRITMMMIQVMRMTKMLIHLITRKIDEWLNRPNQMSQLDSLQPPR